MYCPIMSTICLIFYLHFTFVFGDNVIDVDDILSEKFMPSTLVMLENPNKSKYSNHTLIENERIDGTFNIAMQTMGFHRLKMNEYLCRNYVAEQIINDMTLNRINRRIGDASDSDQNSNAMPTVQNNLIKDEGSINYKNWLSKSATLADIYQHYDTESNEIEAKNGVGMQDKEHSDEAFDGHVTGVAYQPPNPHQNHRGGGGGGGGGGGHNPSKIGNSGAGSYYDSGSSGYGTSGGGAGGGGGGSSYGGGGGGGYGGGGGSGGHGGYYGGNDQHMYHDTPSIQQPPKVTQYHIYQEAPSSSMKGGKGEKDLSELFEIALTALAFLAFKMFLIHVIMCITMTDSNPTTTMATMMMSMSMDPNRMSNMAGFAGGGNRGTSNSGEGSEFDDGSSTGVGINPLGSDDQNGGDYIPNNENDKNDKNNSNNDEEALNASTPDAATETTTVNEEDVESDSDNNENDDKYDDSSPTDGESEDEPVQSSGEGYDSFKFRYRRQTANNREPPVSNHGLNELARRVLMSIDAAMVLNEDKGVCLRKTLCETNKYSRELQDNSKIFLPVFSLGMSWLSGRLIKNINPFTVMLDSLKASVLGLGKANCQQIYQNCELRERKQDQNKRGKIYQ